MDAITGSSRGLDVISRLRSKLSSWADRRRLETPKRCAWAVLVSATALVLWAGQLEVVRTGRPDFRVNGWPTPADGKDRAMVKRRRRFEQQVTLQDRIAAWAKEVRAKAAALPPGPERDALLKKARQAETALNLEDWANSPGLQPPKLPG
jgi:hypothetical protein